MERRSSITLEIADNGIIKTTNDFDVNGTGGDFESTILFEIPYDSLSSKQKTIEILYELIDDLNLEIGSKTDKEMVCIEIQNGPEYEYSKEELEDEIKKTEERLKDLKEIYKEDS